MTHYENVTQPQQRPIEIAPRLSSLTPYAFVAQEDTGCTWEDGKADLVTYGWSSAHYLTGIEAQAAEARALARELSSMA